MTTPTRTSTPPTSDDPNVTTVNSLTEAVFRRDHAALAKLLTDDFTLHIRGPVPPAGDHDGVGGLLEATGTLFAVTEGNIELDQQFCLGCDEWAVEWERAVLDRDGKTLESMNSFVYRFEGERIADMWMYFGVMPDQAEAFLA